jgi:hypothetical protein
MSTSGLDGDDLRILHFEDRWWKGTHKPGMKSRAIRREFGLTETAYYQRLNAIIQRPEPVALNPLLVRRLRRINDGRHRVAS